MDSVTNGIEIIEGPSRGKVLIVSDSHGRYEYLDQVMERVCPDFILHLGDSEDDIEGINAKMPCPTVVVKGNCDYGRDFDNEVVVTLGNHRAFLTHGHLYNVKFDLASLARSAIEQDCDYAMFGHTHVPEITEENGVIIYNPGSISLPRQDGRKPSFIVLDIDAGGNLHASLNYLKRDSKKSAAPKKHLWFFS